MGMFFRDDEDDVARRRAENDDRSMFFHSDEDDGDDEGSLFWNSKNKISYDELYGGETGRRIFENTAKRFEKIKNNNSNIKNENIDLWRANKGERYYYIKLDIISYEDKIEEKIEENKASDVNNYNSGNYFKTLEIAKQVFNSDIWKNRFWDYRKNKNIRRSDVYYTIDFLLGEPTISTELNVSFKSNFDFEEGNYFNTKREAIEFLKVHYHNSIKRIKDFTNNLMKEKGYAIRGYDLKKEISDDDKKFIEEIDKINNEMAETNKEEEKLNKKAIKLENKYKNLFKDNLYYLDENTFLNKIRLNKGETYYFLFEENIISVIENYDSIDNERFKIGNYFTTLEIANQVLNSDIYQNRYKGAKEKYTNNLKWRLNNQYYCLDFSNGNILREVNKGTNLDEKRHKSGNFFGSYEEAKEVKETLWSETWKSIRDIVNKNLGYGYKQENLVEAIQVTKENISDIIKMLEINNEKSFNYIVNWNDELEEIWYKENPYSNEDVIIVKANSYIVKFSEIGNKPRFEFYAEEEFKRKFKKIQ